MEVQSYFYDYYHHCSRGHLHNERYIVLSLLIIEWEFSLNLKKYRKCGFEVL